MAVTSVDDTGEVGRPLRLSADVVWPARSAVVRDGAVLIDSWGRITAVGSECDVPAPPGARVVHVPDAVLLPGFVNAHTHLELHGLRGQIGEDDFFAWIQHVRRAKEGVDAAGFVEAARVGLTEAWRCGTTYVMDTGTSGGSLRALEELGGAGVYFHEVIAPGADAAAAAIEDLARAVAAAAPGAPRVRVGVSPHAPYTVSPDLYRRAVRWARGRGLRLAGHVAESRAEWEFVVEGVGPFAELWRRRGLPIPPRAASPVAQLHRLGVLGPDFWAIHAVQLTARDVTVLRETGTHVVACPRSNARHGHGVAPLGDLLRAGVPVALGTDSVASVETMDILAEARAAAELAGLSPVEALDLVAWGGGALMGDWIGHLNPGFWGDVVVCAIGSETSAAGLADRILEGGERGVLATFVAGRCVYSAQGDYP